MMLIVLAILGRCSAQALNPDVEISQYRHTSWRLQDGILPALPQAIGQTSDGYIWIGTIDGLLRFDGVRFTRWEPPQGQALPSRQITTLKGDGDGSLWIGTYAGLAHLVKGNLVNYTGYKGAVEQLLIDHTGSVWFTRAHIKENVSAGPLCQVQGVRMRCFGPRDGLPFPYAEVLAEDTDGFIWVGTDVAVARWKAGSSTVYSPPELQAAAGQHGVEALLPSKDGSMWVGITRVGRELGLRRISGGQWKPILAPGFDSRQWKVWALLRDSQDSMWIGTTDKGLYRVHDGKVAHFGASDGLTSDSPMNLFEDKEGTLWVSTSEGLDRFRALPVNTYSMRQGLSGPLIRSVLAANDGSVWITNNGAIDILKDGAISSLRARDGLPGDIVQCVFQDREGRFWVGVDDKLAVYDHGKFTTVDLTDKKPIGPVRSMTEDRNGDLWAVIDTGKQRFLYRIHDSKVKEQRFAEDVPPIHSVYADLRDGIWLGLESGDLASYKSGKLIVYPEPRLGKASPDPLRDVIMYADGSVMAAYEEGLIEWRNGESKALTVANGLPCSYVGSFVKDQKQTLYLNMSCGIVSISQSEIERWWNNPKVEVRLSFYDAADGAHFARQANSHSATKSKDGRLWFASVDVLQMVDPAQLSFNRLPPPVTIEHIVNDGKGIDVRDGVVLSPHLHSLQFDYTALSFVAPQKVLFRYRLEGHDRDWQDAGTRRQALYNDLPPGSYRFHVIASNNDGIWNQEGAGVGFVVQPALYQRTSFKLSLAALICIALWMLYLFRISILSEQIRARLGERNVERERIARDLHDTLLQGFQGVLLRFQTISKRLMTDSKAQQEMEETIARADSVLAEARDKVWQIRASSSQQRDLASYVSSTAEELSTVRTCDFSLHVLGTPRQLLSGAFEEIGAIVQEALINAFRHSEARAIEVELQFGQSEFHARIHDDGKGLPDSALGRGEGTKHWGLLGMQERAKKLGGSLQLRGWHKGGTEVQLTVPASVCYQPTASKWSRRFRAGSV